MAQQTINTGTVANDGTGDTVRASFTKANANFTELYTADASLMASILTQHAGHVSQRAYPNVPKLSTGVLTVATAADTVYYTPMLIPADVTIDRLVIKTGTANAVAANANIGVYNNTAGSPLALRASIAAAPVPGTANTNIFATPGAGSLLLPRGFYWFAVQLDAAPVMSGHGDGALHAWFGGTGNAGAYYATTSQVQGYTEAVAYASGLPANAAPTATVSSTVPTGVYRVL